MEALIVDIMNEFGYLGIMFLIALENIFPPIPSEIILPFSGFLTTKTNMTSIWVIFFATIGSTLGAIILYAVGNILNKDRLEKLVDGKVGKLLHFKSEDIDKAYVWFEKKGFGTVFFGRCVPIVRSLISIPAGMADMNFFTFLGLTTLGSIIWNSVLILLGAKAGSSWHNISNVFSEYSYIVKIVIGIAIVALIIKFFKKKILKVK